MRVFPWTGRLDHPRCWKALLLVYREFIGTIWVYRGYIKEFVYIYIYIHIWACAILWGPRRMRRVEVRLGETYPKTCLMKHTRNRYPHQEKFRKPTPKHTPETYPRNTTPNPTCCGARPCFRTSPYGIRVRV